MSIVLGLVTYFFPVNAISKKNCTTRRLMRRPRGLKVRLCVASLIDLNYYLAVFTGEKLGEKIFDRDKLNFVKQHAQ